jgi:O-antigen ligase
MSTFAIIQFFASPELLYGVLKPLWGGIVFGPYVNHNHYAGLMEMLIPIAAASVLSLRPKHPAKPFLLFAVLISIVSVFLSGSRGGTIALTVEFAIFAVVIALSSRSHKAGEGSVVSSRELGSSIRVHQCESAATSGKFLFVACAVLLVAALFFSWLDPGDIWKRWQQTANTPELAVEDRLTIAKDSLRLARQHLSYGVGLGAFEVAYPKYQTLTTDLVIDYAHNDYAQLLAEAGILSWIFLPASIAMFLWLALRGLREGSGSSVSTGNWKLEAGNWLHLGAAVGVCGLLVHSFVDFNLHIPSNAAWFAFCCAVAVSGKIFLPQGTFRLRSGQAPRHREEIL